MSANGQKDFRRNNASKAEGNRVGRWSNIAKQTALTKGRPDQPHSPALASVVADMDQPGTRIAVPRGDASDPRLTAILKHAELVRVDSIATAIDLVQAGKIDGYAAPRVVLLALSNKAPGSRVLGLQISFL